MKYVLTEKGKENVKRYIRELEAKRKDILDAGKDSADETTIPTEEDILSDVSLMGINWDDPDGPCYYNGWGVTDNHEADAPILLKLGRDLIIEDDAPKYELLSVTRSELEITESFYRTKDEAIQAMVDDIIISTPYENIEEIKAASQAGECGFSDTEAWAESHQFGTSQWKIVEIGKGSACEGQPRESTIPAAVYLYKQYRDDYSYDEEMIMVFPDKQSAENQLRSDVEDHFLTKWDDIPEAYAFNSDDVFQSDCVKYYIEGKAATLHWIIEERPVEK